MIYLPLLICIIGAIAYALSNNSKVMTLARDCFWVGLLVFLLTDAPKVISTLR